MRSSPARTRKRTQAQSRIRESRDGVWLRRKRSERCKSATAADLSAARDGREESEPCGSRPVVTARRGRTRARRGVTVRRATVETPGGVRTCGLRRSGNTGPRTDGRGRAA
jgi:hypothetical protein